MMLSRYSPRAAGRQYACLQRLTISGQTQIRPARARLESPTFTGRRYESATSTESGDNETGHILKQQNEGIFFFDSEKSVGRGRYWLKTSRRLPSEATMAQSNTLPQPGPATGQVTQQSQQPQSRSGRHLEHHQASSPGRATFEGDQHTPSLARRWRLRQILSRPRHRGTRA
jgi:hypothetical protein